MFKWIRISIIVILLIGLVVGGIYYYRTNNNNVEVKISDIYKYIPTDAALIIESKNISNLNSALNHSSKPWSLLTNLKEIQKINKQINFIDSIMKYHPLFKFNSNKGPVILSFHPSGKNDINYLFIINLGNNSNVSSAKSIIQDLYHQKASITEKTYNDEIIYSVLSSETFAISSFHFYFKNGLLIISPSSLIIESVIRLIKSDYSLLNNASFNKVISTSGKNVAANIFINNKLFSRLWKKWVNDDIQKSEIYKYSIAEWSAIDLHVSQNMFLLNGFTDHGDSLINFLKVLSSQEQEKFTIANIAPKEAHTFLFLAVNQLKKWQDCYSVFLESYGAKQSRDALLASLKKKNGINIIDLFDKLIYKECGIVYSTSPLSNDSLQNDDVYFIINTDNQSSSKELLDSVIIKYAQLKGTQYSDYIFSIKLDNDLSVDAYNFPISNIPELLFGSVFSNSGSRYFSFIDNYIVFTKSKQALQRIIYANTLKKTLQNEPLYRSYTDMLDKKSNLLFYCDIARAKAFLNATLNKKLFTVIQQNFDVVRQMDALSCQISNINNLLYTSIYIRYSPEIKQNTHTVWESKLDTTTSMKPFLVINHNTQEKEIFVQDDANNIYLLNNSGRILWKNNIPERIKSEVFQVDLMKNKRLQYLFSTKNYIYIIDRNGEVLENYPIKLKASATNGVSLITFDSKNESRLYVACSDKKVYCYTLTGKLDKNWKFETTNHFVYQPIQYVKYENKEYIYFVDTLNLYIVGKDGKKLINEKVHFPTNKHAMLYFSPKNPESDACFLINDIEGTIHYIYLDGSVKSKSFDKRRSNHYFLYNDMDGDGYADYIFADDNDLIIYKRNKKVLLNYSLPSVPKAKPVFYEFPFAKNKIGIVCEKSLFLIDKEGKMPNGFPLKGISPFSISLFNSALKTYFLITSSDNGYLLNYEIYK